MLVPLEVVNEMCVYMKNSDLVNMARVCKQWQQMCMRRLDTFGHQDVKIVSTENAAVSGQFRGHDWHLCLPMRPTACCFLFWQIPRMGSK
jgi:hypothetical protein